MKRIGIYGALPLLMISLTGCGQLPNLVADRPEVAIPPAEDGKTRPKARPAEERAPPKNADSAEEFDTTTSQERKEAAAVPPVSGEMALGVTVASLGDPAKPGFWLETPLVKTAATGRVEFAETGKSAQVDLIPIEGPATAGSRISLAAMRLIGAPLTGLPELKVFRN